MDQYNRERLLELVKPIRRIVVKVGTNLIDSGFQELNRSVLARVCEQIATLMNRGKQVILVSSGAIGCGLRVMGKKRVPVKLPERQALAAVGQARLMDIYRELFQPHGIEVSQILLTRKDLEYRQRYVNGKNTMETLLSWKVLPIVNENDTVAVEEIKVGDNDNLSAAICNGLGADLLVILTDIDGLYYKLPTPDAPGIFAEIVECIDDKVRRSAGKAGSHFAIGGMRTKVDAADMATKAGALVAIANGKTPDVLPNLLTLDVPATWFLPPAKKMQGRKRWILGKKDVAGEIQVDMGAKSALAEKGKSLLPSGVWEVKGNFPVGALIKIVDPDGTVFARGLCNYSGEELRRVKGKSTAEIRKLLPGKPEYCVVHRDDLVVI